MKLKPGELDEAAALAGQNLLAQFSPEGHWIGQLSSSALSTATAICALQVLAESNSASVGVSADHHLIQGGLAWLAAHQNSDGGWGDTDKSFSNISTSALCWAAFGVVPGGDAAYRATLSNVETYLAEKAGGIDPEQLAHAIIRRYGKDRTFSVPILTMCAISGRLGQGREAWRHVIPLPFEIGALPHKLFAILRMPVVSYALPALIAIGQARHVQAPSRNPLVRLIRAAVRRKTSRVLANIQPASGGFLEATPLTSFVCMSLAASGQGHSEVAQAGLKFLRNSVLADGSWPIDTNLATWVTTLSVQALGRAGISELTEDQQSKLVRWLLGQQYRTVHPYTQAAPGGWAWTDLSGGVPDADDTASALLALEILAPNDSEVRQSAVAGIKWLLGLQNSDGGIPTFCRGWTHLPFDQSSPDITAHTLRAWIAWKEKVPRSLAAKLEAAIQKATIYLDKVIQVGPTWVPLWFGNQHERDEVNLTYGTCKVLLGLAALGSLGNDRTFETIEAGIDYLVKAQTADGGWSGGSSQVATVEETALAVETLSILRQLNFPPDADGSGFPTGFNAAADHALIQGVQWLLRKLSAGEADHTAPIGFYFAKLWYYEKLYPTIFLVGAFNRAAEVERKHPGIFS